MSTATRSFPVIRYSQPVMGLVEVGRQMNTVKWDHVAGGFEFVIDCLLTEVTIALRLRDEDVSSRTLAISREARDSGKRIGRATYSQQVLALRYGWPQACTGSQAKTEEHLQLKFANFSTIQAVIKLLQPFFQIVEQGQSRGIKTSKSHEDNEIASSQPSNVTNYSELGKKRKAPSSQSQMPVPKAQKSTRGKTRFADEEMDRGKVISQSTSQAIPSSLRHCSQPTSNPKGQAVEPASTSPSVRTSQPHARSDHILDEDLKRQLLSGFAPSPTTPARMLPQRLQSSPSLRRPTINPIHGDQKGTQDNEQSHTNLKLKHPTPVKGYNAASILKSPLLTSQPLDVVNHSAAAQNSRITDSESQALADSTLQRSSQTSSRDELRGDLREHIEGRTQISARWQDKGKSAPSLTMLPDLMTFSPSPLLISPTGNFSHSDVQPDLQSSLQGCGTSMTIDSSPLTTVFDDIIELNERYPAMLTTDADAQEQKQRAADEALDGFNETIEEDRPQYSVGSLSDYVQSASAMADGDLDQLLQNIILEKGFESLCEAVSRVFLKEDGQPSPFPSPLHPGDYQAMCLGHPSVIPCPPAAHHFYPYYSHEASYLTYPFEQQFQKPDQEYPQNYYCTQTMDCFQHISQEASTQSYQDEEDSSVESRRWEERDMWDDIEHDEGIY